MNKPIAIRNYGPASPEHPSATEILVLHGGPGAPGSAAGLASALADVLKSRFPATPYQVREPLQRTSGDLPLTVERHVEDLAAVAAARSIIVGHSWGAMLGLSYAALYPERTIKLALVGCGTYDLPCRALMRKRLDDLLDADTRWQMQELRLAFDTASSPEERSRIQAELGKLCMDAECYEQAENLPTMEKLSVDATGHRETWNDVLRLQREGIEPARFRRIRCPVMMFHGDYDPHPGAQTAELLRASIPELKFLEFARCGHEPWRERHARESFLKALSSWIAE